jgi:hypothetical protein
MELLLHDSEPINSLVAGVPDIEYGYQAEQWIKETYEDHTTVVRWELRESKKGKILRQWERPLGSTEYPTEVEVRN